MSQFKFQKASRQRAKLRLMVEGASGSGKTWSALTLASQFGKVAVVDTERESSSLYSDRFQFDVLALDPPFTPERFIEAIKAAEDGGYDVIVLDSITHEWSGEGGCLNIKDSLGGKFQDWAKVTPRHERFVNAILGSKCHIVATCRSKQAYSMDEQTKKVTKLGLEPQQRDGLDYEMTVVFQLNQNHMATATKDRTLLFDGKDHMITADTAKQLIEWLGRGVDAPVAKTKAETLRELISSCGKTEQDFLARLKEKSHITPEIQSIDELGNERISKYITGWASVLKAWQ